MTKINSGWTGKLAMLLLFNLITLAAQADDVFSNLQSLDGAEANPYVGLTQGPDGALYGTAIDGGSYAGGSVFKFTGDENIVTPLYDFCAQSNCPDGQYPDTVLALGIDGSFYGTTQSGGTQGGYGTVFKITATGVLTTLHSFDGADGAAPYGSLVLSANGDFYGTTNVGGTYGGGNVFEITPNGTLTTLYTFCSEPACADGQYPVGPLFLASDGNIYGTTHAGGNSACTNGCGTVFKITPSGTLTTLHSFNGTDGSYPYGGVVEGPGGTFYGTTGGGGVNNFGTVFQMNGSGVLTTLHGFDGTDGATPYALTLGTDGKFYGTTSAGGANYGTIFKITTRGTLSTLHKFHGADGSLLYSGLIQDTNGLFYGTTYFGGDFNDGTIFELYAGLRPFVAFVRNPARVGQTFGILGQGFKGTTAVWLNGAQANFTVRSDTLISATVPAGARTGDVTVTTPGGTLKSNVPLYVIP